MEKPGFSRASALGSFHRRRLGEIGVRTASFHAARHLRHAWSGFAHLAPIHRVHELETDYSPAYLSARIDRPRVAFHGDNRLNFKLLIGHWIYVADLAVVREPQALVVGVPPWIDKAIMLDNQHKVTWSSLHGAEHALDSFLDLRFDGAVFRLESVGLVDSALF